MFAEKVRGYTSVLANDVALPRPKQCKPLADIVRTAASVGKIAKAISSDKGMLHAYLSDRVEDIF